MPERGPRLKKVRRLGTPLPGLTRKSADRHPHPPGQHGGKPTRRRSSEYRRRLQEKQKLRYNYGVSERQLQRYMERARVAPGNAAETLLATLERRLDNVVFRLGFAPTIPAARQLVVHGHVQVGGRRVDRPSYLVQPGDTIALTAKLAARGDCEPVLRLPGYLARDPNEQCTGRVISTPARSDVPLPVDESLIVEFYAR